jgi:hypothetical protein
VAGSGTAVTVPAAPLGVPEELLQAVQAPWRASRAFVSALLRSKESAGAADGSADRTMARDRALA